MNNEPVAWAREDGVIAFHKQKEVDSQGFKWLPLYTHPAKPIDKPDECISGCPENQTCDYCAGIKTLTDEEIADFEWAIKNVFNFSQSEKVVGLDNVIRAILRKAQTK